MTPYNTLKIKFGKYKGTQLQDIPNDYLIWLYNNGIKGKIKLHIQHRFNMLKTNFKILEIYTNTEFSIMAYNLNEAFKIAGKQMGSFPQEQEFKQLIK